MRCPYCGNLDDRVVDSRVSKDGKVTRRRRECSRCEARFTTYETVEEVPLTVIKNDERREPYDRGKLLRSMRLACAKRPVTEECIDAVADEIELELFANQNHEASSRQIGEMVMSRLATMDDVAYIRFASVYKNFRKPQAFLDEVRKLL